MFLVSSLSVFPCISWENHLVAATLHYEIIEDGGTYGGEIPGLQGVWARHATLEGCRRELREALSDWIALRLRLGLSILFVEGVSRLLPRQWAVWIVA